MCGIVGYIGPRSATPLLLEGLRRLEYRGYDSAGLAVLSHDDGVVVHREVGRVADLARNVPQDLTAHVGIAHTRWATHGGVTKANAHPHLDSERRIAVVHNGIVENAPQLRGRLEKEGVVFHSETDTEVIPHLIRAFYTGDPVAAVRIALQRIQGTYGIAVVFADHPDVIIAARNGSPMVLGLGDGEILLGSDPQAIIQYTRRAVFLSDGEVACISRDGVVTSMLDGVATDPAIEQLDTEWGIAEKGDFEHYMLKEINEQEESIRRCLRGRVVREEGNAKLGGPELTPRDLLNIERVEMLACGTSFHAGLVGAMAIERLAQLPATAKIASEYRYRNPVIGKNTLFFAVSQSGETADTLGVVKEVQIKGGEVLGIVNVVGSSIARMCGRGIYVHSGPEVAVASTKAFTSQVTAILRLAPSTVSAHLKELRLAGLVEERKQGRWVYSRLVSDPETERMLEPLWAALAEDPEVQADARLLEKLLGVELKVLCRADLDLGALGLVPETEEEMRKEQRDGRSHG